jgi:hypothetical protein
MSRPQIADGVDGFQMWTVVVEILNSELGGWAVTKEPLAVKNSMLRNVGFEVLTAMITKMAVFWVVAPCSLITLMMEAASTSETSVNFYQTTRFYYPEDSHLHVTKC